MTTGNEWSPGWSVTMQVPPLSRGQVREIDRRAIEEFGVPGVVLMENAGRAVAHWLIELGVHGPIVVCCGKGNNGGDGYVVARHLDCAGHAVEVVLACDPAELRGDAQVNFRIVETSGIPIIRWDETRPGAVVASLSRADWIVDGLLGTGATGEVREPTRSLIEAANASAARKFAIDIPSGLDSDTGRVLGVAVRASHTATFVATKIGFANPAAAEFLGEVRVFDIGVPARLLAEFRATGSHSTP